MHLKHKLTGCHIFSLLFGCFYYYHTTYQTCRRYHCRSKHFLHVTATETTPWQLIAGSCWLWCWLFGWLWPATHLLPACPPDMLCHRPLPSHVPMCRCLCQLTMYIIAIYAAATVVLTLYYWAHYWSIIKLSTAIGYCYNAANTMQCSTQCPLPAAQLVHLAATLPHHHYLQFHITVVCLTKLASAPTRSWSRSTRGWRPSYGHAICYAPAI